MVYKCGIWADKIFYPNLFKKMGFIVEHIRATEYNLTKINGDIDSILTPIPKSRAKIFIEIKNKIPYYTLEELVKFFNNLCEFDGIEIIPIVIARRIYENVKEILQDFNGEFVEMEKIIIYNEKEFSEISKEYNQIISNITRVLPYPLIQPDIFQKLKKLKGIGDGYEFFKEGEFEIQEFYENY